MIKLYEDTPLDPPREILLLRLRPRPVSSQESPQLRDNTPLFRDLYSVTISKARNQGYEALSYTWGSMDDLQPVQINGTEKRVTKNLYAVLQQFRGETRDVVLWVKAVCINQEDDEEKSIQVHMIRDIYLNSASTRVWLGLADDTSNETMTQLAQIGSTVNDQGVYELFVRMTALSIRDSPGSQQAEEQVRECVQNMLDESLAHLEDSLYLLRGVYEHLCPQYWSRAWILQEIVVSSNLEIYCGSAKVGFTCLHAAISYIIYMKVYVSLQLGQSLMSLLEAEGDTPPEFDELKAQLDSFSSIEIPQSASLVSAIR
jgi:hypothetical protein